MQVKKIIKKYGKTLIINFNIEEQKVYGLKEGDCIELVITKCDIPERK